MNRQNCNRKRHIIDRNSPAGTSLVECVLVMAVGSVLTGIVVTGMAALMQFDHRQSANTMSREQLQALLTMLRDDAHRATAYQLDIENQSLQFSQPGQRTIEYRFIAGDCNRIQSSPASEEQTMRLRFPADLMLSSESLKGKQSDLLRIQFQTSTTDSNQENKRYTSNWQLELVAQVGRDLAREYP